MSKQNGKHGTSHRKVVDEISSDPEIFGFSKTGIILVFTPALLAWAATVFMLPPSMETYGWVVVLVLSLIAIVTLLATPDDESVQQFIRKYWDYYTNQKVYIHETRKYSETNDKNSNDDYSWGF